MRARHATFLHHHGTLGQGHSVAVSPGDAKLASTRDYARVDSGLVLDAVIAIRMHMGLVIVIRELMGRISEWRRLLTRLGGWRMRGVSLCLFASIFVCVFGPLGRARWGVCLRIVWVYLFAAIRMLSVFCVDHVNQVIYVIIFHCECYDRSFPQFCNRLHSADICSGGSFSGDFGCYTLQGGFINVPSVY